MPSHTCQHSLLIFQLLREMSIAILPLMARWKGLLRTTFIRTAWTERIFINRRRIGNWGPA